MGTSVGCDSSTFRAFLWENGSLFDLNTQIPDNSSLQLAWPLAIDAKGEISGVGVPPGVPSTENNILGHAFVLIPIGNYDATDVLAVTQDHASQGDKSPLKPGGLTSREIIARIHARMSLSHRFGF